MITLGDKVKDTVTGLVGIATARCTYLNGCDHIAIQPPAKDGKIPPAQWVDLPQVEVMKASKSKPRLRGSMTGGPSHHPPNLSDAEDSSWRAEDMYTR